MRVGNKVRGQHFQPVFAVLVVKRSVIQTAMSHPVTPDCALTSSSLHGSTEGLEANQGLNKFLVQKITVEMRNDQMLKVTTFKFKSWVSFGFDRLSERALKHGSKPLRTKQNFRDFFAAKVLV
jgi:hypothetical protein